MTDDTIVEWKNSVGTLGTKMERVGRKWTKVEDPQKLGFIKLPGYTYAFDKLGTAVQKLQKTEEEHMKPVLFMMCI